MKKYIYMMVAFAAIGLISAGFTNRVAAPKHIRIQSNDPAISVSALEKSKEILLARLHDLDMGNPEIQVLADKKQLEVSFESSWNKTLLEKLLTQKGAFAFYEVLDIGHQPPQLKKDKLLHSIVNGGVSRNSNGPVGCVSKPEFNRLNRHLDSISGGFGCKLAWSANEEKEGYCLYALRDDDQQGILLSGSDMKQIELEKDPLTGQIVINIQFRESAIPLWAGATRRNLDHPIALVLDNQVIFAPVVRSVIEKGNCTLSGNISQDEGIFIAVLGNHGELPVSFSVVE